VYTLIKKKNKYISRLKELKQKHGNMLRSIEKSQEIKKIAQYDQYDLLIVYSASKANSAQDLTYLEKNPFSSEGDCSIYNDSYSYFLQECKKLGLKAAFTTSKDVIGPGLFQSFWTYDDSWVKHNDKIFSKIIFDKFTPISKAEENQFKLMFSDKSIFTFNNKVIYDMFTNKLCTYDFFKEFTVPSILIDNFSRQDVLLATIKLKELLSNHEYKIDFNSELILKDLTGAGGYRIHKINLENGCDEIIKHYESDKKEKPNLKYLLQPFINCTKGFVFDKYKGMIDLRIIMLNKEIIQTYIRISKENDFKCNEHQGGDLIYIEKEDIPSDVINIVEKIIHKFSSKVNLEHSLYALDFIKSNNGTIYFIEGNTNPGIDWNHNKKINELKSKELINIIVNELKIIIDKRNYLGNEKDPLLLRVRVNPHSRSSISI